MQIVHAEQVLLSTIVFLALIMTLLTQIHCKSGTSHRLMRQLAQRLAHPHTNTCLIRKYCKNCSISVTRHQWTRPHVTVACVDTHCVGCPGCVGPTVTTGVAHTRAMP
ncbi:hypothetical protein COO60DRAFT_713923 [Scenedesmus sp. NREL 46B-D3]|nr:hypothetical protein COO60DRAFT_713923 [Scenedesmus sp. NREL 46B-D3]